MKSPSPGNPAADGNNTDWHDVRHRLGIMREVLEQRWIPSPEEKEHILRVRADALARPPENDAKSRPHIELVEFALAHETYGIQSSFVREVSAVNELTPLPCTPAFVLGIVNVRGEIVSVIDLKKLFDLPGAGLTDLGRVIILHAEAMTFGILADQIIGVHDVALDEIRPAPPNHRGIRERYLMGVTSDRLVVLDAVALLSDRKIIVHEEVAG